MTVDQSLCRRNWEQQPGEHELMRRGRRHEGWCLSGELTETTFGVTVTAEEKFEVDEGYFHYKVIRSHSVKANLR